MTMLRMQQVINGHNVIIKYKWAGWIEVKCKSLPLTITNQQYQCVLELMNVVHNYKSKRTWYSKLGEWIC